MQNLLKLQKLGFYESMVHSHDRKIQILNYDIKF